MLFLAILAWAGVGFFITTVQSALGDRSAHVQQLQQQSDQSSQVSYLHSLVTDTAPKRAKLDALANVDPASLADTINSAGKAAGINIQISSASQGTVLSADGKTTSQALTFLATTQGSYAAVMYALQLLETLPLPSTIQTIQMMRSPSVPGAPAADPTWQMNAQIRILTAPSVSS